MKLSDKSKEYISQALLLLMENKEYNKITIKEIVDKAGVSRLTFYRNFKSKDQVLIWYIHQGFQTYLKMLDNTKKSNLKSSIIFIFLF